MMAVTVKRETSNNSQAAAEATVPAVSAVFWVGTDISGHSLAVASHTAETYTFVSSFM